MYFIENRHTHTFQRSHYFDVMKLRNIKSGDRLHNRHLKKKNKKKMAAWCQEVGFDFSGAREMMLFHFIL